MKIKIAHLYYDLLNIDGEYGNIRVLKYVFEQLGIDLEIEFLTINDKIEFNDYDLVYMGMGINENLITVCTHLSKYKKEIKKAIENNKFFLCTGNSYELFGKKIENTKALEIFDFESKYLNNNDVFEVTGINSVIKSDIIGFINRTSNNNNVDNSFLKIKHNGVAFSEGIHYKNFFGTYTLGPLLVRNPEFLMYFVENIIKSKDKNYVIKNIDLSVFKNAYSDCVKRRSNV